MSGPVPQGVVIVCPHKDIECRSPACRNTGTCCDRFFQKGEAVDVPPASTMAERTREIARRLRRAR